MTNLTEIDQVLASERRWAICQADRLDFLRSLPEQSVDLVFGSPPYEKARTYGIDFNLSRQEWVDWMVETFRESLRVCRGLVGFVLQGQVRQYRWSAVPALLMADLHRSGVHLRNPPIFHRVGIPGSGGPDWLRSDYEWIVCATNGGKLPWSDNTACGHPPKWGPGGEMSYRDADGKRKNAVPKLEAVNGDLVPRSRKARSEARAEAVRNGAGKKMRARDSGEWADKESVREWNYVPPGRVNPGNVLHHKVGGGLLGSPLAHQNEAPFPQSLAAFFVRSFCPLGGIVCDPFSGSGTTGAAAVEWHRRFIGCDIRESQVELTKRRLSEQQPRFAEMS